MLESTWLLVALCSLTAVTVLLNLLVLLAFAVRPALRQARSNLYIASLAVTDLLVGAVAMPVSVDFYKSGHGEVGWRHSEGACVFWLLVDMMACTASVWTMVAVAGDRLMVRKSGCVQRITAENHYQLKLTIAVNNDSSNNIIISSNNNSNNSNNSSSSNCNSNNNNNSSSSNNNSSNSNNNNSNKINNSNKRNKISNNKTI